MAIIAYSAFGLMGYWLRGNEGERNNCFSTDPTTCMVKNIETKQLKLAKRDSAAIVLVSKPAFFATSRL